MCENAEHSDLLGIVEEIDEADVSVSDWEANFIDSILRKKKYRKPIKFSSKQRMLLNKWKLNI